MGVRFLDEEPASAPAAAAPAKGRVRFLDGAETAGPEATPGGKSFFDHVVDLGRGVATHIPSVTSPIQLGNELAPKLMTSEPVVRNAPAIGMTAFGAASGGNPVAAGAGGVAGEAYREVMDYMKTGKAKTMFDAIWEMGKQGTVGAATQGASNVATKGIEAGGAALRAVGKEAAELGQAGSGVPAWRYKSMAENPSTFLPPGVGGPKTVDRAEELYRGAMNAGDLDTAVTARRVSHPKDVAKDTVQQIFEKWTAGEPISGKEALNAKQSMRVAKTLESLQSADPNAYAKATEFKKDLDGILSLENPDFMKQSQEVARALTRKVFLKLAPVNKDGSYSIGRSLIMNVLGKIFEMPVVGAVASSPMVHGAAAAVAGTGYKVLRAAVGTGATRMAALSVLADHIEQELGQADEKAKNVTREFLTRTVK